MVERKQFSVNYLFIVTFFVAAFVALLAQLPHWFILVASWLPLVLASYFLFGRRSSPNQRSLAILPFCIAGLIVYAISSGPMYYLAEGHGGVFHLYAPLFGISEALGLGEYWSQYIDMWYKPEPWPDVQTP